MIRALKYLLLIAPSALSIYVIAPFGDRCSGLAHVIGWFVLVGVFMAVLLIETCIDLYRLIKLKKPYDLIPIVIAGATALLTITMFKLETWKPWTNEVFKGQVKVGDLQSAGLTLYANGTFDAYSAFVDFSCNYEGRYELSNDTLTLLREDLPELTNGVFTTRYYLQLPDSTFSPVEGGFEPILNRSSHY
jgi:hypothetical protein